MLVDEGGSRPAAALVACTPLTGWRNPHCRHIRPALADPGVFTGAWSSHRLGHDLDFSMQTQRGTRTETSLGRPIDLDHVLAEIGGDEAFLRELVEEFLAIVHGQLATLRQAIADEEVAVVAREAHAIKGGAANLTAVDLSAVAATLETMARAGTLDHADEVLERLADAWSRLERFTRSWQPAEPAGVAR